MDIIKSVEDLEKFKDYESKVLRFEGSVRFEIDILVAGGSIEAGGYIFSFLFSVSAKSITTKRLPFWRNFYADVPPMKRWRNKILDENLCWDDLKNLPTEKEVLSIIAWEGWHWIIRGHLECFFGLKKSFIPPGS